MRKHARVAGLAAAIFATACGGGAPLVPLAPRAASLTMVSGDGQEGDTGGAFKPFVVRVTDASGAAIPNVPVLWKVVEGVGRVHNAEFAMTPTDSSGQAEIILRATGIGHVTVMASVGGTSIAPVAFTANVTMMVIYLSYWATAGFAGPDGIPAVTVPVGTPVEWRVGTAGHVVASSHVPPGGAAFRSQTLNSIESFRFVPATPGTWTYYCELHESEGTGTLDVR